MSLRAFFRLTSLRHNIIIILIPKQIITKLIYLQSMSQRPAHLTFHQIIWNKRIISLGRAFMFQDGTNYSRMTLLSDFSENFLSLMLFILSPLFANHLMIIEMPEKARLMSTSLPCHCSRTASRAALRRVSLAFLVTPLSGRLSATSACMDSGSHSLWRHMQA